MKKAQVKPRGVTLVKRRDGSLVSFNSLKIDKAIFKAMKALDMHNERIAKQFTQQVINALNKNINHYEKGIPTVEQIQTTVEQVLEKNYERLFKVYSLYRRSRHIARELRQFFKIKDDLKFSANALKVLEERYLLKDDTGKIIETPTEMFRRISRVIAFVDSRYNKSNEQVKKTEAEFFEMMKNLEFLPNSPTIMNAGTNLGQLSACFVLPIEDSLESIFTTLKHMALIQQSGGGTGFSFSKIRADGDMVKSTKGIASGPVSFINIFDATTEVIKQGGKRRGANMAILHCSHPDIERFILAKQKERQLSNFNISVAATDEFMQAALENKLFSLVNPRTKKSDKKINARKTFELLCDSAWQTGDPGIVFIDEINRKQPTPLLGKIESTNPCVAEGSLISTNGGLIPIEKIHNPYFISTISGLNPILWAGKTGVKEVFNIKTNAGFEINATADHKILTTTGWKEAEKLTNKDKLVLGKCPFGNIKISKEEALALGWLIGDGHLTKDQKKVIFFFNKEDKNEMLSLIKPYMDKLNKKEVKIREENNEIRITYSSKIAKFFINLGIRYKKAKEKEIPLKVFQMEKESIKNILSAIFGADGSVQGNRKKGISIRLASSSLKLLKQIQLLLLQFDILSKVYENRRKAGKRILPDSKRNPKEFFCNADHELIISRESAFRFMKEIGFSIEAKQKKFEKIKPFKIYKDNLDLSVKEIKKIGTMKVYDISEPKTHSFVANGLIVHNCGEVPLLPFESCNLGSINLSKFVANSKIDWQRLQKTIHNAIHFLDNVIDANKYPLLEIEKITKANRKIGLGIMGFADMLIKLRIPYNSNEALALAEKIMGFITKESRTASIVLAKSRGSFPNFDKSIWKGKVPCLRNATCTTIAPTGSISIIAGCSSGIEPLFAMAYVREIMEKKRFVEINHDFQIELIKKDLFNDALIRKVASTGSIQKVPLPRDLKKVYVTALDILPEWHVKMQAAFQKHTDNAVSKTVNLPQNAKPQEIRKIFLLAWKLKCQGITIYRYGSKPEQVLYLGKGRKLTKAELHYSGGSACVECSI